MITNLEVNIFFGEMLLTGVPFWAKRVLTWNVSFLTSIDEEKTPGDSSYETIHLFVLY
jgi:hypothetical protein